MQETDISEEIVFFSLHFSGGNKHAESVEPFFCWLRINVFSMYDARARSSLLAHSHIDAATIYYSIARIIIIIQENRIFFFFSVAVQCVHKFGAVVVSVVGVVCKRKKRESRASEKHASTRYV